LARVLSYGSLDRRSGMSPKVKAFDAAALTW